MNSEEEKVKEDKEKMRRWFNEKYNIQDEELTQKLSNDANSPRAYSTGDRGKKR